LAVLSALDFAFDSQPASKNKSKFRRDAAKAHYHNHNKKSRNAFFPHLLALDDKYGAREMDGACSAETVSGFL
jgi:hypothetical protein